MNITRFWMIAPLVGVAMMIGLPLYGRMQRDKEKATIEEQCYELTMANATDQGKVRAIESSSELESNKTRHEESMVSLATDARQLALAMEDLRDKKEKIRREQQKKEELKEAIYERNQQIKKLWEKARMIE